MVLVQQTPLRCYYKYLYIIPQNKGKSFNSTHYVNYSHCYLELFNDVQRRQWYYVGVKFLNECYQRDSLLNSILFFILPISYWFIETFKLGKRPQKKSSSMLRGDCKVHLACFVFRIFKWSLPIFDRQIIWLGYLVILYHFIP